MVTSCTAKQIQNCFRYLLEKMQPDSLLLYCLMEKGVINEHEMECIKRAPTRENRNELLLLLILRQATPTSCDVYLEALKGSDQGHVAEEVQKMNGETVTDNGEFDSVTADEEKQIRAKIIQHATEIQKCVDPFEVRPYLFEKDVLSLAEYEDISERRVCCKTLLSVLERKEPSEFPFLRLKIALAKRYKNIVSIDTSDDGPSLRACFRYLLSEMEPDSGLPNYLYQHGIINENEKEAVDNLLSKDLKNEYLLLLMIKRPADAVNYFLKALTDSGQKHVADTVSGTFQEPSASGDVLINQRYIEIEDEAKKWIKARYDLIMDTVDSFDVRPYLFEKGVLTLSEYEETSRSRVTCQPLIDMLLKHDDSQAPFTHLIRALEELKGRFEHIVDKINQTTLDSSYLEHPRCLKEIDLQIGIWGLVVLRGVLYVATHNMSTIRKFKADEPYTEIGEVDIAELRWPSDMASDERQGCVYISDRYGIKKNEEANPGIVVLSHDDIWSCFPMDVTPGGLSLLRDGRLVVVCEDKKQNRCIRFYRFERDGATWRPDLITTLDLDHVERYLLQAVVLTEDTVDPDNTRIAISQVHKSTKVHRIVCVDGHGSQVAEFGERNCEYPRRLQCPWSLVVDSDGMILANDADNRRVLILRLTGDDSDILEYQRDLITDRDAEAADVLFFPRRIFFDAPRGVLYVGSGCSNVQSEARAKTSARITTTEDGPRPNADGNLTIWQIRFVKP